MNAGETPATTGTPSDYVPQVGDVVEFKYERKSRKGIVFMHRSLGLSIACGTFWLCNPHIYDLAKVSTAEMDNVEHEDVAIRIARAYFAKSFTPAPDKSYAENQAAWVKFHGLKVGSKVKVVKKFEAMEGGSSTVEWDYTPSKVIMQGQVIVIKEINSGVINTKDFSFPYFALEPVSK